MTAYAATDRSDDAGGWLAAVGRRADAVLVLLIAINLVPIWAFSYFPSLDGPAHVSLTWWLVHYDDADWPTLRAFLEPNLRLVPNYLIFFILYPLMTVFPAAVAEKLLISLYAVLLPLALRYALAGAAPQARGLAVIGCVVTFHALLLLGFYNTSFAIALFLLAIGFWLRRRRRTDLPTLAGYAAISLVAYVTHLSAVASTCLAIFFATVGLVASDLRTAGPAAAWRRLLSHGIWPAIGFAPVLALCLGFLFRGGGEMAAAGAAGIGLPDLARLIGLVRLEAFIGHEGREIVVTIGLALTLYWAARTGVRYGSGWVNAGLFILGGFAVLYLVMPFQFDVRWMPTRLMPYALLGALLWIAGMMRGLPEPRRVATTGIVVLSALALTLVGTGLRLVRWSEIDQFQDEYTSANAMIEPNATLLALRLSREIDGQAPSDRIEIMLQMPGYIAAERNVIDLKHFQAHTGAFPLVFRETVDPYRHLLTDAQILMSPETIRPTDYREATGQTVDYVLLWGEEDALPAESPLAADLSRHYELIHTSEPRGAMRLYRLAD